MEIRLQESIDFTCKGKCSKCGECCSNLLPLTNAEIRHLREIVKKRKLKPHYHILYNAKYDMTCPFLNDQNKCSIYEDRPYICKIFKCDKKAMNEEEARRLLSAIPINLREVIFK